MIGPAGYRQLAAELRGCPHQECWDLRDRITRALEFAALDKETDVERIAALVRIARDAGALPPEKEESHEHRG